MSVLDQIKKLDAQKKELLSAAKAEALNQARNAIADLNALGFEYHLAEGPKPKAVRAATAKSKTAKPRRTGMRDQVHKLIAKSEAGLVRKEVAAALKATEKADQVAISNALAALKKAKTIKQDGRVYKLV